MSSQKPLKTSVLCALVRRDLDSRGPSSIASSQVSCAKGVTSPLVMAPEENPFTAESLKTRTSSWSTPALASFPWLMLAPTPTAPSSSSALPRLPGLTTSMLSSVPWQTAWMSSEPLRTRVGPAEKLKHLSWFPIADSCKGSFRCDREIWRTFFLLFLFLQKKFMQRFITYHF